jgi:hypothetical protein
MMALAHCCIFSLLVVEEGLVLFDVTLAGGGQSCSGGGQVREVEPFVVQTFSHPPAPPLCGLATVLILRVILILIILIVIIDILLLYLNIIVLLVCPFWDEPLVLYRQAPIG